MKSNDQLQPESAGVPLTPGNAVSVGNYVIKLGIGTPSKPYIMVVDTGSSFNWLQCQPCQISCHAQVGPIFNPKASSTYKLMSCNTLECANLETATLNPSSCSASNVCIYGASYGDGSYSAGYLSRDTLTFGPSQILPGFIFGCGQDNNGLFGQTAGIVGLSRNKLSLLAQLSPRYGYVFSYCLPTISSIGTLSIGRSASNPSYEYTPMYSSSQDSSLYFLRMTSIAVAGKVLPVSRVIYARTPTIIDSGTVITRLPPDVYTALKGAFVRAMTRYKRAPAYSILDTCFKGSAVRMTVPEVRMVFEGGSNLKLEAQNVLYQVSNGISCLAFASNGEVGEVSIIGNHQQLTFTFVYDVANSKIGFAPGGCH